MLKLPKENADLKRLICKRMIPPLVLGSLLTVCLIALECYAFVRFWNNPGSLFFSCFLYFVVWIVLINAVKFPERLKDRSYEGEIVNIHLADRHVPAFDLATAKTERRYRPIADLTIKDTKGKTRVYQYKFEGKIPFKVGDRVRHYAATDYIFMLDEHKPIVCINCGHHWEDSSEVKQKQEEASYWGYDTTALSHIPEKCTFCGKTLIKRPPTRG